MVTIKKYSVIGGVSSLIVMLLVSSYIQYRFSHVLEISASSCSPAGYFNPIDTYVSQNLYVGSELTGDQVQALRLSNHSLSAQDLPQTQLARLVFVSGINNKFLIEQLIRYRRAIIQYDLPLDLFYTFLSDGNNPDKLPEIIEMLNRVFGMHIYGNDKELFMRYNAQPSYMVFSVFNQNRIDMSPTMMNPCNILSYLRAYQSQNYQRNPISYEDTNEH